MYCRKSIRWVLACLVSCVLAISTLNYASFMLYENKSNIYFDDKIHVALIFDQNRVEYGMQAIRSSVYYSKRPIVFHLVVPPSIRPIVDELNDKSYDIRYYDHSLCKSLTNPVLAFASRNCHISSHCKIYLAHIIPVNVKRVLYMDNDVTATQDISRCFDETLGSTQLIAMGPDMGDVCQREPDVCWPMSFEYVHNDRREPYQFNSGVILMDLDKMRNTQFVEKFRQAVIQTARIARFKKAPWGEQDFINSFFRIHPNTLKQLPCGCNYQYVGVRRHSKCPDDQPVYLAHGWRIGIRTRTDNPYNRLFYYFKTDYITIEFPPFMHNAHHHNKSKLHGPIYTWTPNCPHQSYNCDNPMAPSFHNNRVYVITRTSGRRSFFTENMMSVREQTHPFISHLVTADNDKSQQYLTDLNMTYTRVTRLPFDHEEPCRLCSNCAAAPGLEKPQDRAVFFDCYCNTSYPMNTYFNSVQGQLPSPGWIIYLDDDNIFADEFTVSDALAHVTSKHQLLIWRSYLKRPTPSDRNWGTIVMGDIDTSGFMFYSDYITHTQWNGKRCADYRTILSLSTQLQAVWVDKKYVYAHPLRERLGGLGMRRDMQKLTVIVTSYRTDGFRPLWVKRIIDTYTSIEMSSIVDKVILVWNNPENKSSIDFPPGVIVLRMIKNSLNNRWIQTIPYINTDMVLNLDDDLLLHKSAIVCMMSYWHDNPYRLIGPFVRSTQNNIYTMDALLNAQNYSVLLPRAVILHKRYFEQYAHLDVAVHNYIDTQEGHCDDIALNIMVSTIFNTSPLRVLLPVYSVLDFYDSCYKHNPSDTGGLALQDRRSEVRTECLRWIQAHIPNGTLLFADRIGICGKRGVQLNSHINVTVLGQRLGGMIMPAMCTWPHKFP